MSSTNICTNNHTYDSSLKICPYCPSQTSGDETVLDNTSSSLDKTMAFSGETIDLNSSGTLSNSSDAGKTQIFQSSDKINKANSGRKLVGWLVTYSWDENGQDFKLREGKTSIGGSSKSEIQINDPEISGLHATLLYRKGEYLLKDEFSTNGTQVNGNDINDSTSLNDGDIILIGKTVLLFRSSKTK